MPDDTVIAPDGLIAPRVGQWATRKYHFLGRYLDAFTTAMRDKWPELHYIDLFSGAGLAQLRGTQEFVETSGLLAASTRHPFTGLHLVDLNPENVAALRERVMSRSQKQRVFTHVGDANALISAVLKNVPSKDALCLTFADPYGLHLSWATVVELSNKRSDLIVLLADNMDALRNWAAYYFNNTSSSLDMFMGESGWRELLLDTSGQRQAERLRSRYLDRLRSLGYAYFDEIKVQNSRGADIYTLLFASKAAIGLRIWRNVSSIDESGQRDLPFT